MDARRFPPRQDAESENPLGYLSNELLLPRGKAAFFGYFLCGGKQSDPAAQRSEALQALWELTRTLLRNRRHS
jgi:hypothetical protein